MTAEQLEALMLWVEAVHDEWEIKIRQRRRALYQTFGFEEGLMNQPVTPAVEQAMEDYRKRKAEVDADAVPAKKPRGRPKKSDVDRKTYQRELMRKKRAALKEAK